MMNNKRPILLQGAMEVEINYFKQTITDLEEIKIHGYEFFKGNFEGYPIIISKTKVGLIEASLSTFIGITNFNPIFIINQGTAGACGKNLHIGDIIIGEKCVNINSFVTKNKEEKQGVSPLEWDLLTFKEGKDELIEYIASKKLSNIVQKCKEKYTTGKIVLGTIGSGDIWDKEVDRIEWFNKKYNVLCEEMEAISVYTVCDKLNIPVIGIRVISNNEILKESFDSSVTLELQKFILDICKELVKEVKE